MLKDVFKGQSIDRICFKILEETKIFQV